MECLSGVAHSTSRPSYQLLTYTNIIDLGSKGQLYRFHMVFIRSFEAGNCGIQLQLMLFFHSHEECQNLEYAF